MAKVVGYLRVSTQEQGQNRNGLQAQRAEIERYCAVHEHDLVSVSEEVLSGAIEPGKRPVLSSVLSDCRLHGHTLIVSKLDRLSRDSHTIGGLMNDSRLSMIICALGEGVDRFMLQIYAALAEKERAMVSERTRAALAQLKAKGKKLGNPRPGASLERGRAKRDAIAAQFADNIYPRIKRLERSGMTLKTIAQTLNSEGCLTLRGKKWDIGGVFRILSKK